MRAARRTLSFDLCGVRFRDHRLLARPTPTPLRLHAMGAERVRDAHMSQETRGPAQRESTACHAPAVPASDILQPPRGGLKGVFALSPTPRALLAHPARHRFSV